MRRTDVFILLCFALPLFAQSSTGYHIVQTYALGGDGAWDYIVPEPEQHRVFIGRTNRVMHFDPQTNLVEVYINRLRQKMSTAAADPKIIQTVPGSGYCLRLGE